MAELLLISVHIHAQLRFPLLTTLLSRWFLYRISCQSILDRTAIISISSILALTSVRRDGGSHTLG